jgi:hypothetical protein
LPPEKFFGADLTGKFSCLSYRQISFGDKKQISFLYLNKSIGKEKNSA